MVVENKDKINKDRWIKKTECKLFGHKIFERIEICDNSNFQMPQADYVLSPFIFGETPNGNHGA